MRHLFYFFLFSFQIVHSQTPILTTDFQQGIPSTFTIIDNDNNTPNPSVSEYSSAWISTPDPDSVFDTVAASTSYFEPTGIANRWLITPQLSMGSFGNYLSWNARSHDPSFPDDYLILVSTSDNQITSFNDTIGHIVEENNQWTNREVNLSDSGYNNQSIYIAFVNITDDGYKLYIDDINVRKDDPLSSYSLSNSSQVTIYPNPSSDYINVNKKMNFDYLEIISVSGKKIIESSSYRIDINHLKKGLYYVNLYQGTNKTCKLIIKN